MRFVFLSLLPQIVRAKFQHVWNTEQFSPQLGAGIRLICSLDNKPSSIKLVSPKALSNVKGPWYAGFSKLWMIYHVAGDAMHQNLVDVCNEYRTIARMGSNDFVTSDPEVV